MAVLRGSFENQTTWLAVQEFGLPLSACPQPDAKIKIAIDSYNSQLEQWSQTLQAQKSALENPRGLSREKYINKVNTYNDLVSQYNAFVAQIKILINQYNSQIELFNECVR